MVTERKVLVYLFGIPGAGKTSVLRALFPGHVRRQVLSICPHVLIMPPEPQDVADNSLPSIIMEIGKDRDSLDRNGMFSGTDALSMSIQPKALELLRLSPYHLVIAEGDRLANRSFWEGATALGWSVYPVLLDTPVDEAAHQRRERGTRQNATWVQGRITKVQNLRPAAAYKIRGGDGYAVAAGTLRDFIRRVWEAPLGHIGVAPFSPTKTLLPI